MRRIATTLLVTLTAALLLAACSKPWTHPDFSGAAAEKQFKEDSLHCEVVSGTEYPIDKHKQLQSYEMCMSDLGWVHHRDAEGITFRTKPR